MIEEIKAALADYNGDWSEKNGVFQFKQVVAERKAFLSRKKLTYSFKFKVDEENKALHFSEILMESGSGLSSGGYDDGMTMGAGFKTTSYNTFKKERQETIEEQSNLFGKKFDYEFDFKEIRTKVEAVAKSAGYKFEYQIMPVK